MSLGNAVRAQPISRLDGATVARACDDVLAVEEPLEIRVGGRGVAVVMRTPGHDRELAAGFLLTEGLIRERDDVLDMVFCHELSSREERTGQIEQVERDLRSRFRGGPGTTAPGGRRPPLAPRAADEVGSAAPDSGEVMATPRGPQENVLDVLLAPHVAVDFARLSRNVFTSSSCGICSKASIDAVRAQFPPITLPLAPKREVLAALPEWLRAAQTGFAVTGGSHASALFTAEGDLVAVREDVGRHNALDKVIGQAFFAERLPLGGHILLVSGRVSFELVQKALAAGIPCIAAISAPTSAAVELARASGQTLVGFLRGERMNVYAGTLAR